MDFSASGTVLYRNTKCCTDGKDSSEEYVRKSNKTEFSVNIPMELKLLDQKINTPYNTPKIFVCPEHGGRLYPSKNQCYQYKILLQRIRSLLNEIKAIRKNESTGICEFCKRYNSMGRCKRCEILGKGYIRIDTVYEPQQQLQKQQHHQQQQQCQQLQQKYQQHKQQQHLEIYGTNETNNSDYPKQELANEHHMSETIFKLHQPYHLTYKREVNDNNNYEPHQQQQSGNKHGISETKNYDYQQQHKQKQQQNQVHTQQQRFMMWLSKVKQFLFSVLESEATQHKLFHNKDSDGTVELTNLLNELKFPLNVREPYIRQISSSVEMLESLNESNNILKEVVQKLTNEKHYHSAVIPKEVMPCPSTCKYFSGRKPADDLDEKVKDLPTQQTTLKEKARPKKPAKDLQIQQPTLEEKARPKRPVKDQQTQQTTMEEKETPKKRTVSKTREDIKTPIEAKATNVKASPKEKSDIKTKMKNETQVDPKSKGKRDDLQDDLQKKSKKIKSTSNLQTALSGPKPSKDEKNKEKEVKSNHNAEDTMMAAMLKAQQTKGEEKTKNVPKVEKALPMPKIEELPVPKPKPVEQDNLKEVVAISESVMECNLQNIEPTRMIKGTEIVPIQIRTEHDTGSVKPALFKIKQDFIDEHNGNTSASNLSSSGTSKSSKAKNKIEAVVETKSTKGVISYELSNREFIEKGWTLLPTTKIMRRMNVYKMKPASPQYDWFKNHQNKRVANYDTGEHLAEIDDNGNGKWYYKNGSLALDFYSSEEINSGHRYVIYSSGEKDALGKKLPVTVLASFDYLGNGVVYDHYGNERIKYNQSEGIVIDKKIGAPGHWKWHTLNEPPVLQPQFIDTYDKSDACIEKLLGKKNADKMDASSKNTKEPDLDMIAIELENIMKEKANKLLQEFKPFQIKMKALKINDQFSLKILDQSKIYLIFRDGKIFMKLNLGMLLMSNEIVDTVAAELFQVATPYDVHPPKSQSIADIQKIVEKARNIGKVYGSNERNT